MAAAYFHDLPCQLIRAHELMEVDLEDEEIIGFQIPHLTIRQELFLGETPLLLPLSISRARDIFQEDSIKNIIKNAEKWMENDELKVLLNFALRSHSFYSNFEYNSSFIMSWLIIEQKITALWKELINNLNITGDRKKKLLKNHQAWSSDHIIEGLNLKEILNGTDYSDYMRFKNIRNKIVHDGMICRKDNAKQCLEKSIAIIKKMLSK